MNIPVKVKAPSRGPAPINACASTSDSPEQPPTNTRPFLGSTEARSSRSRRRGDTARYFVKAWKSGLRFSLNARTPSFDSSVS